MLRPTSGTTALLTGAALAIGGGAAAAGQDVTAHLLWAGAAAVPLARLVGDMWRQLRRGEPGVDIIALLAVSGALVAGEYLTAGVIGLMLATGQFLDDYAAGRAQRELTALLDRAPRQAHRLRDGVAVTVPLDEVVAGDLLVVKSGEVVPVDGVLDAESAVLDESALTGEPIPVTRRRGDVVSSGTVNGSRAFEMRAIATAEQSTYAGIIRLVTSARESSAPMARLADRWAAWFIPVTLVVAGGAWIVSGDPLRALAVLVVATPCPLLLAVPIAIVSGVSRAAKQGVIFRGGGPLEALAGVTQLLIDKTGTLTAGAPTVRSIELFDQDLDVEEVLRLAASLDQTSTHVLAHSIVAEARRRNLALVFPSEVEEIPGGGVVGVVAGRTVGVGSAEWLLAGRQAPAPVSEFRRRMLRVAPMAVFVAIDGEVTAALLLDDPIRPDAASTVRALRKVGVERVVMATGDHPVVAQSVGLALGLDRVLAECSPAEKVEAVQELRADGITAMVGDGINDAPALASADVGVAMGVRGATASSEAADVVLMVDRFSRLVDAIDIAQRSKRIALQSVAVGMGLSLVAMGVAAGGWLVPIAGAVTQEVIDVIAIVNALRALAPGRNGAPPPRLSPERSAALAAEHEELVPRLEMIRHTADRIDQLPPADALAELRATRAFLVDVILPHEAEDERLVYPEIAEALGGDDPLAAMSRTHREIFHLIDVFGRMLDDIGDSGPDRADLRDLARIMYGLHAILVLHFDQEEELYSSLDENYARTSPAVPELDRARH